ncbi:lytic transglycosylase [Limnohabitans sp. 2KL-17]|uniref:lytic transglycosylase domain-containing protein n=1 Tax=Limnohabitans sp. 2KL-17 TaxID=1100704 RepID=UPI000D3C460E|nr:lytic transglycosylase domain-containing protein [Limnohabitans sp. 2KL-17]PUE56088.1 lytic transglycosylase [Limnohabitans sp. 2KL-17]
MSAFVALHFEPITRRQALQRLAKSALLGTGLSVLPFTSVHAGTQVEEQLSTAVRTALSAAVAGDAPPEPVLTTPSDQQAYARWLAATGQGLVRFQRNPVERQEFLQTLWYEARRAGLSLSLVLGLVQVESAFRKHAVSSAGAMGFMQVMPFWARSIGDGDQSRLFHMQTNLRFGCVILRHYLDRERGDLFLGLGRYNGSRGQAAYPDAVLKAQRAWLHGVD